MRTLLVLAVSTVLISSSTTPLGLDVYRPTPADNPLTSAKIALGRTLFHDRRLSADGATACATCHEPSRAFTDGRVTAKGVYGRVGQRNAPAIINRVYGRTFFWDGRAPSLERQVVEPLLNASEMAGTPDAIVATVRSDGDYRRAFDRAFGRPPEWDDVARALASYVRTIRSGNSAYDRYQRGDRRALSSEQQQGMRLFLGRANCWECHSGPTLSDERFHNTGIAFRRRPPLDVGRFVVSKNTADLGAFKTPTLREVARTAPYMHDGSIATLADVIDHYDRGGSANPNLDPLVKPLRLTVNDKRALVAFLRTLNGQVSEGK